jgi:hydroxylamine reductase (hybrid-cluster protein)
MDIDYQKRHYAAVVQNEDVEDPDAIISINADSQSFYVLNQGKEVIRTREQLRAKRAKEKEDRERKIKEKNEKTRVLELEQVEELKEKLNRHMIEIRRLFA